MHPAPGKRIHLWLLGGFRLEIDGEQRLISGGKLQALLAYLLLHPTLIHSRERLVDLFWPYADPTRSRRYLSDTLYRLQQTLGYDWLVTTAETLRLAQPSPLMVDVWTLTELVDSPNRTDQTAAVNLYKDDLLPELYDDWLLPLRVRLRDQVMNLLVNLAESSQRAGQLDAAFTYFHRLTALDPLNEPAHRGLMRLYHAQGRPAAALAQYAHLEGLLKTDLDVEPLPETAALAAEIRAAYERQQDEREPELPLIGRRQERAALLTAVNAARQGQGGLFILEGEAGIGKSSLLREVAAGASWRGLAVGQGSGQELGARTGYMPLDGALADLMAGGRLEQLRQTLSSTALSALEAILPQLSRQTAAPLERPADLSRALLEVLATLSQPEPLLLILDDVQWASDTFWELISFAAELAALPVLVVMAYRPVELRANPNAWQALEALDLAAAPRRLSLTGLSAADSQALATASGHDLPQAEMDRLARLTGGNPLYLLETLAADLTAAPPALDHLLGLRLDRLSPPARQALDLAAVLGREVDHGQWQAALGKNLAPLLPELLQGRFLQETSQGYAFQHDLVREQVYAQLSAAERRKLHARTALALQQGRANPATLAWHFEQAGQLESALHFHRLAGENAMRTFAYATALGHFEAGYALLVDRPDSLFEDVWRLLFARQQMLELTGPVAAWRAAVAEMQARAGAAPNSALELATLEAQLQVDALESDIQALQANAAIALELAQQLGDTAAEIRIRNVLSWHLMDALARPRTARDHLERAATLAAAQRDPRLQLTVLGNLALAQRLTGQSTLALQTANQMVALTHLHPGLERAQALALQSLANAAMHRAEWETAWSTINTAVARFEELDDLWALGDALFDRILIGTRLGQLAAARQDIDRIISAQKAMGLAPDSHYRMWSSAYLCLVLVQAEDWPATQTHLPILRQAAAQQASIRVAIQANTVLGLWHLRQADPASAQARLAAAVDLWLEGEPSIELSPVLYHALASHQNNDPAAARRSLALAEQFLAGSDARHFNVLRHYVASQVHGDPLALVAARAELTAQTETLTEPALRRPFLQHNPLHQLLTADNSGSITAHVQLPARERSGARLTVKWTLADPLVDAAVLERDGPTALRRFRLQRLLQEAAAQGAAPTNDDLANALNVSRRTIQRDLKSLDQDLEPDT